MGRGSANTVKNINSASVYKVRKLRYTEPGVKYSP